MEMRPKRPRQVKHTEMRSPGLSLDASNAYVFTLGESFYMCSCMTPRGSQTPPEAIPVLIDAPLKASECFAAFKCIALPVPML